MKIEFDERGIIVITEQLKAELRSNRKLMNELVFMSESTYYDGCWTPEALDLVKELKRDFPDQIGPQFLDT